MYQTFRKYVREEIENGEGDNNEHTHENKKGNVKQQIHEMELKVQKICLFSSKGNPQHPSTYRLPPLHPTPKPSLDDFHCNPFPWFSWIPPDRQDD